VTSAGYRVKSCFHRSEATFNSLKSTFNSLESMFDSLESTIDSIEANADPLLHTEKHCLNPVDQLFVIHAFLLPLRFPRGDGMLSG
jgi:hypothetical protein